MSIVKKFLSRNKEAKKIDSNMEDLKHKVEELQKENAKLQGVLEDIDKNFMSWYEQENSKQEQTKEEVKETTIPIKEIIKGEE